MNGDCEVLTDKYIGSRPNPVGHGLCWFQWYSWIHLLCLAESAIEDIIIYKWCHILISAKAAWPRLMCKIVVQSLNGKDVLLCSAPNLRQIVMVRTHCDCRPFGCCWMRHNLLALCSYAMYTKYESSRSKRRHSTFNDLYSLWNWCHGMWFAPKIDTLWLTTNHWMLRAFFLDLEPSYFVHSAYG